MVALGPITRVTGRTTGAIWWPEGLIIKTMLEGTISTGRALALDMLTWPIAREDLMAAGVMAVVGVMAVGVTGKRAGIGKPSVVNELHRCSYRRVASSRPASSTSTSATSRTPPLSKSSRALSARFWARKRRSLAGVPKGQRFTYDSAEKPSSRRKAWRGAACSAWRRPRRLWEPQATPLQEPIRLARKNHANTEATTSLRARNRPFNRWE